MSDTWILVADSTRARLFALPANTRELREVEDFFNPQGRAAGRDLVTERPARTQESADSSRHAIEPHTTPKEVASDQFARQLAGVLEHGQATQRYERLVLIAPPRFLGALHANSGKRVHACIVAEINKDLTTRSADEIREYLPQPLPRAPSVH